MAEKFSYGGQFSNKRQLQRIAFQKVWCEEMREEQIMNPTLISRTVIIGVRNIYDYSDALLEWTICSSEDYNKVYYLYHLKKDLPTNKT